MFILRKVFKDGTESNKSLGDSYNYLSKETSKESFNDACGLIWTDKKMDDNCYAIVVSEGGKDLLPLYISQRSYIMTESGKTFANVTSPLDR